MNWSELLLWHNMIFLLPFGVAALLVVVSILQMDDSDADGDGADGVDGGDGADSADGDAGAEGLDGDGADADAGDTGAHTAHGSPSSGLVGGAGGSLKGARNAPGGLAGLIGVGRAPLTLVLELFCMSWGFCGFWANQLLLKTAAPTLAQMLPSFGVATVGGVLGARLSAEILSRFLPQEETSVRSGQTLYGMTGRVLFPVSESAGRLRIYDEAGTLHEHPCRIASGHPPIAKGRRVLVMDRDAQGHLIVEEIAEPHP